jgi:hypothetical protein
MKEYPYRIVSDYREVRENFWKIRDAEADFNINIRLLFTKLVIITRF